MVLLDRIVTRCIAIASSLAHTLPLGSRQANSTSATALASLSDYLTSSSSPSFSWVNTTRAWSSGIREYTTKSVGRLSDPRRQDKDIAQSGSSTGERYMASMANQKEMDGLNVLGQPLQQHGVDPVTGFFRDGYCRPSSMDPAEHTLAGVLTKEFLEFSKERGNDLMTPRGGFPGLKPGCRWCLCVSRWKEAYLARTTHPAGDKIVPHVDLAATSITVLGDHPQRKVVMEELNAFKEPKKA